MRLTIVTGKPLRQFMYSDDLAYVIEKCIYNEIYDSFNVSNSENVSINEIAKIALKACDADYLEIEYDSEKQMDNIEKMFLIKSYKKQYLNFLQQL